MIDASLYILLIHASDKVTIRSLPTLVSFKPAIKNIYSINLFIIFVDIEGIEAGHKLPWGSSSNKQ